jgi:peptide/nickel transport system ATP-binding protein
MAEHPLLSVENLSVSFGTESGRVAVVEEISFEVPAGKTVGLVGESGCGKSVSAMSIMRLLPSPPSRIDGGRILFGGRDLTRLSEDEMRSVRGDRIGMIFQEPMTSLNPTLTVGYQIAEVLRLHRRMDAKMARVWSVNALKQVGIGGADRRLEQYPHQLSGGLRQRVMIAMALMCEPELLVADEPTTALDVTIQAQILRLLADLRRELGIALLLITHDLGVVARIADRVNVMYAGAIVESATATQLFADPRHPYTRGLLACLPRPGVARAGERLGTIPGVVPSLIGGIVGCAFRSRCPVALHACATTVPEREAAPGHRFACVHETVPEGVPV